MSVSDPAARFQRGGHIDRRGRVGAATGGPHQAANSAGVAAQKVSGVHSIKMFVWPAMAAAVLPRSWGGGGLAQGR